MIKNGFYLTLKAFFIQKNRLITKIRLISKSMISQPGTTNNCNTYIAHISKSKDCQTVKFGQLIEYNVRKIFLETPYPKCGGETSPKPFSENQN